MTSGRRPAGAPADWQKRRAAGAPGAAKDDDRVEGSAPPPKSAGADGARPSEPEGAAPTAAESDSAAAVESDLAALLADVKRERDEYLELAQRARADFENYRKRAALQASDAERRAKTSLARDLLPAVDNLERALETAPADDPLADGVRLVHRELSDALGRAGIEAFDPTGEKFDPNACEALSARAGDGAEPGTVLEVVARGYRLADQVIRPARVIVAE